jgi:hypothetical protein
MPNSIIPIGAFDTSGNEKDSIVATGWILDGLLDPEKVESAYTKLVRTWPILSARLRTHNKVPTIFIQWRSSDSINEEMAVRATFRIFLVQAPAGF